ncbi:unnamed protein product [Brugia pahangi]|uniref:WASH-7_N domain-containing protein n=1 Tax=Brugia pahangi TaxID=6280 RepID=A0A158PRF9_BRUPA|nr:unnamed protein product [Brugia pahangi]
MVANQTALLKKQTQKLEKVVRHSIDHVVEFHNKIVCMLVNINKFLRIAFQGKTAFLQLDGLSQISNQNTLHENILASNDDQINDAELPGSSNQCDNQQTIPSDSVMLSLIASYQSFLSHISTTSETKLDQNDKHQNILYKVFYLEVAQLEKFPFNHYNYHISVNYFQNEIAMMKRSYYKKKGKKEKKKRKQVARRKKEAKKKERKRINAINDSCTFAIHLNTYFAINIIEPTQALLSFNSLTYISVNTIYLKTFQMSDSDN